jgi:putative hydrolase of the HAD superfamily
MIKGVLLDYGGTIDTNGVHWAEVLWNGYLVNNVKINKIDFKEAYKFAERSLAIKPLVKHSHNFLDVLHLKIEQQFIYLVQNNHLAPGNYLHGIYSIASYCNNVAANSAREASATLQYLSSKYPMVMVSNFYGNLETVLTTFAIGKYFQSVVESAVVGVRKPMSEIYTIGVERLQLQANECVVIGDSYSKDMVPGKEAGCQTIWLKKEGFGDDPDDLTKADKVIADFRELQHIL